MTSVLFICTANRFRSPLAEYIFRSKIEANGFDDLVVSSAGTWTVSGVPALDEALVIARSYGLDISSHRSTAVNGNLLIAYDLILVMESGQKEAMSIEFPAINNKIILLSEATGHRPYDIPDPSCENESPKSIGAEIYTLISEGFQHIISLAKEIEQM